MKNMEYWKSKNSLPGINNKSEGTTDLPDGRSASSPLQAEIPKKTYSTKEDDPSYQVSEHTTYKHPTYYSEDGSIVKGSSTGDFDEGELSEVKKDKSGRRYVEKSTDIGGGKLYLDPPK